jgi:hypothetical protein
VPAQVDHLEGLRADADGLAVHDGPLDRDGSSSASAGCATVTAPVASTTSGSARWWSQCPCVVTTVRTSASAMNARSASGSAAASISSASPESGPQQVGVVGHLADRQLADRQPRQLPDVGRTTHLDVPV